MEPATNPKLNGNSRTEDSKINSRTDKTRTIADKTQRSGKKNPKLFRQVNIPGKLPLSEYMQLMGLESRIEDGEETVRAISNHSHETMKSHEKLLAKAIMNARKERKLTREQMGELLGINPRTYGRYERAEHAMTVGMFINLCEIFGCYPFELLGEAAPQFWGRDKTATDLRLATLRTICQMSEDRQLLFTEILKLPTDKFKLVAELFTILEKLEK